MKITDLTISSSSLGNHLWLVDVVPAYAYKDNRRTDVIQGYRYIIALPEKGLEKISVRIDGAKRMEAPNGYVEVRFDNLELFLYWGNSRQPQVGARAAGIHLVNPKA